MHLVCYLVCFLVSFFFLVIHVFANFAEPHIGTDTPVSAYATQGISPACAP